ncbi:hypothetical protein FRX31_030615, partial [Thalictrum thalictroides]
VRKKKPTATTAEGDTAARKEELAKQKLREKAEKAKEKEIQKAKEKAEKAKEKAKQKAFANKNPERRPIAPGGIGVLSFENGDQYVKLGTRQRGKYFRKHKEQSKENANNVYDGGVLSQLSQTNGAPSASQSSATPSASQGSVPVRRSPGQTAGPRAGSESVPVRRSPGQTTGPRAGSESVPVRRSPRKHLEQTAGPSGSVPNATKRKAGRPPKSNPARCDPSFSNAPGQRSRGFQFLLFGDQPME